jgi:cytidylate kinase
MTIPSIIAIDGPAASGKSTLGLRLADELGYLYFDTGVMYRAVTWAALDRGLDVRDEAAVTRLAEQIQIDVRPASKADSRSNDILVDEQDASWAIRSPEVEAHVSLVSAYPGVRKALMIAQRRVGQRGRVVMVGRDIGTVVLPEADIKIYLDASVEERARRRYAELVDRGEPADYEDILTAMRRRDQIDSTRKVAPLRPAPDARILSSNGLDADQVVALIKDWVYSAGTSAHVAVLPEIALITILTDHLPEMKRFYQELLGFQVKNDAGSYVEFEHAGVRFALCTRQTMYTATHHPSFLQPHIGQAFELAFPCPTPADVDRAYQAMLANGAAPVAHPADMPWKQRTAFFADPDGNIHELFCDL